MDKNAKIIYNSIDEMKFNSNGYIDLDNVKIRGQTDLASVCDAFRNPCYETFRIIYMKENKIVAHEAFTSRIPNTVFIAEKIPSVKFYEKVKNRMQRLAADGYYLAHNHTSNSSKPSQSDMKLTVQFANKVKGFLGHIVLANDNKYSIIESNSNRQIVYTDEMILSEESIKNTREKLRKKSLYDIKIKDRDDLVSILKDLQNDKEYSIAILTDAKCNVRMIVDIPNRMFNQDEVNLNGFFKNLARNTGSTRVLIGTQNEEIYSKIAIHQKYGTIKDYIFLDLKNRVYKAEKIEESYDLFEKKKNIKMKKNQDRF